MNHDERHAAMEAIDKILREHCSNYVICVGFAQEDGSLDDIVVSRTMGTLHGCIGLTSILAGRLDTVQLERDDEEELS